MSSKNAVPPPYTRTDNLMLEVKKGTSRYDLRNIYESLFWKIWEAENANGSVILSSQEVQNLKRLFLIFERFEATLLDIESLGRENPADDEKWPCGHEEIISSMWTRALMALYDCGEV